MTVLVMVKYCELVFISPCLLFQTLIYRLLKNQVKLQDFQLRLVWINQ